MGVVFAALRIPSGETEFAGFLVQLLVVGGIVSLLLLLVGVGSGERVGPGTIA